jgi:hypothetical protein
MMEPTEAYQVDSRLIFFRLEKLEEAAKLADRRDALHAEREEKLAKDINEAHTRIRELQIQGKVVTANLKTWIACGAAGGLMAVAVELLRALVRK